MTEWTHLLLFDGVCHLCDQTVQWVLRHDQTGVVRFCSIQSELGAALYRQHGFDPENPHSMLLITPEGHFVKSDAVLKLVALMGGKMAWWRVLTMVPGSLRDAVYSFIAVNRYRFFGKKAHCVLSRPEWSERFLG
jgi:predicted DCC family thiol-disulfide oxidoreductase YuxK